jgi:DNA-binding MarR family transcriptional regulator
MSAESDGSSGSESTGDASALVEFLRGPRARMLDVIAASGDPPTTSALVEHGPVKRSSVRYHIGKLVEHEPALIERVGQRRDPASGQQTDVWALTDAGGEAWDLATDEPGVRGEGSIDAGPVVRGLGDDLARAEQRVAQVEARFGGLETRFNALDDTLDDVVTEVELEQARSKLGTDLSDVELDVRSHGKKIERNEDRIERAHARAENAEESAADVTGTIASLEDSVSALRSEVGELREDVEDVREDLDEHAESGKWSAH